jgi:tRNA threonylcarbamoyladenosine biosynthesis protein TsaB
VLVAALDTATLTLSCALLDVPAQGPPRVRRELTERAPGLPAGGAKKPAPEARRPPAGHGARLPGALQELLLAEGLDLSAVEGYAVGLGPGSFTGLRIGLATWKGLAYANQRPIAGTSSLAAMAMAAAPAAPPGAVLVPLLDAKKGEVYAGFYRAQDGSVRAVEPEMALSPGALVDVAARLPGTALAFGEGYAAFAAALEGRLARLSTEVDTPTAPAVAALAACKLAGAAFDRQALFALEPHYVRKSEAEVKFPHGLGPQADPGAGPLRPPGKNP